MLELVFYTILPLTLPMGLNISHLTYTFTPGVVTVFDESLMRGVFPMVVSTES